MDDPGYRYPIGSAEHFAAYEREFRELGGAGYEFPGDVEASYEVDYAAELAYERYCERKPPEGWDTGWEEEKESDSPAPTPSVPDYEIEWF